MEKESTKAVTEKGTKRRSLWGSGQWIASGAARLSMNFRLNILFPSYDRKTRVASSCTKEQIASEDVDWNWREGIGMEK